MKKFDFKNYGTILILSFILLILFLAACTKNQENAEQESITGSATEKSQENCRFSNPDDCSPIEITRGEQTEEKTSNETPVEESINLTDKFKENITIQKISNLTLTCKSGWKCIEEKYIAYQEANCSWHSLERCIYGCNENTSICRTAPICKVNSLKCENDNLMTCGENGYRWLLNKSCDKNCENNICTEDLPVNATLNITTNATTNVSNNATQNNTIQNDFIADACMSVSKYNLTGETSTDEYFALKNSCSYSIDMTSWTANDDAIAVYTFPSFNLANNGEVTVVTGSGSNNQTTLYWGRGSAVWNNGGDTLYLNVSNGTNVLTKILNP